MLFLNPCCDKVHFDVTVPTVEDRIAQMVAKLYFEPNVEPVFYDDSYGYRPIRWRMEPSFQELPVHRRAGD
ncbi:hypothetical protein LC724_19275 [Blautia sp. RD014234]|nr:hypothetical protein [Blautia parvula]